MNEAFDWTPWIAVYAALVATVGIGWQVYTWRRTHATRIVVKPSSGFLGGADGSTSDQMAFVTVYNRSAHPVTITSVGWVLERNRTTSLPIISKPFGSDVPGALVAHTQGSNWMPAYGLATTLRDNGEPRGTRLRAYADDGDGKRHLSRESFVGLNG